MLCKKNDLYALALLVLHIIVSLINVEVLIWGDKPCCFNYIASTVYILAWMLFIIKNLYPKSYCKAHILFGFVFWGLILFMCICRRFDISGAIEGLLVTIAFIIASVFSPLNNNMLIVISIVMLLIILVIFTKSKMKEKRL